MDDPPTLPLFSAAKNTKKCNNNNNLQNIQQNISNTTQAPNQFYPPTGFFLVYPGMFNQPYNNFPNSLPPHTSLPQQTNISISPPSIYEFFENLKENYNECNFDDVKTKFLQEEIDVLDIFNLNDCDWQRLGVKLGIKSKIIREVEKYR